MTWPTAQVVAFHEVLDRSTARIVAGLREIVEWMAVADLTDELTPCLAASAIEAAVADLELALTRCAVPLTIAIAIRPTIEAAAATAASVLELHRVMDTDSLEAWAIDVRSCARGICATSASLERAEHAVLGLLAAATSA